MAAKLKKGDKVVVLAGKDKGKQGRDHLASCPKDNKAVVDGVNVAIRHTKQIARRRRAAASPKAMPIDLSNLALVDPRTARPPASASAWKATRRSASPRPPGRRSDADAATYTPRLQARSTRTRSAPR